MYPLLLLHGYPETKRIWWRNIGRLAEAGFDVIAPDLRGYGDSGLAADGHYDPAAFATDVHALLTRALGLSRCAAVGGDLADLRRGEGALAGTPGRRPVPAPES